MKYISGTSNTNSNLPHSVESYIKHGAGKGSRNNSLFGAASQCRDIGMPLDEAINTLINRAAQDGLTEAESKAAIASAYRGQRREPPKGFKVENQKVSKTKYKIKRKSPLINKSTAVPLPDPIEKGFVKLLEAAFEEGEGVCVGGTFQTESGERCPDRGVTLTREKWLAKIRNKAGDFSRMHTSDHGHYIRVNPIRLGTKNLNTDVTSHRHVLVEFDTDVEGKEIPKDKQLGALLSSHLPISAILDSGNKSIHAWVRVDAKDANEFKERADEVYELFSSHSIDPQNHNPNRYSRCPDGKRTVNGEIKFQRLLAVKVGAENWQSYEGLKNVRALGEPWKPLDHFEGYPVTDDPNTVIGNRWLCKGGSLVIVSQSGVGKSSLQMQMKVGWAIARHDMTFGIKPIKPLKQLTLQAENDQGDVAEVWSGVTTAYNLTKKEKLLANENCEWRRVTTLTGDEFIAAVESLVTLYKPDVCWVDPLLNFIGDDVSKADVISHFCVEGLSDISLRTGCIFALIHHSGKPKDQKTKEGMTASDLAYLGLGSSALTNWAREVCVLNRVKTTSSTDPATFSFTATKRRTRAGMRSIPKSWDDEDNESVITSEIFIRHSSDGRIRWEQCEEPEPYSLKKKKEAKPPKEKKPVGRPSSLTREQKKEIVEIAIANKGKLTIGMRSKLAQTFGVSPKTIQNYLSKLEKEALEKKISVREAFDNE